MSVTTDGELSEWETEVMTQETNLVGKRKSKYNNGTKDVSSQVYAAISNTVDNYDLAVKNFNPSSNGVIENT